MPGPSRSSRLLWPWLLIFTAVGLVIRIASVLGRPHRAPGGDPYAYYWGARLLVAGHGFINPFDYNYHHQVVQSAAFAPLYTLLLAGPMVVGLKTYFIARLWTGIVSSAAIAVVGLAGREIGGRRVGLIAALLTAVYPNIWMPDEIGAAESLVPLLVGALLLFAYRFWKQPDARRAVWFGLAMGALILERDELVLLVLFLLLPLVLLARLAWRARVRLLLIAGVVAGVVLAPWVSFNMVRFHHATFISNEAGLTMASADCNATFSGPLEGYWDMQCSIEAPVKWHGDESDENAAYRKYVMSYLSHHESRLIPVTLAKIGRGFGFFHPLQQINLDSYVETRPHGWALTGLFGYYALLALTIGGSVILRLRRIPIFPMWVIGLNVVIAMAVAFGNTRYRIPFEVPLVIMGSVALDWVWKRARGRPAADSRAAESPAGDGPQEIHIGHPAPLSTR